MTTVLLASVVLARAPFWHDDISVASLLEELSDATGTEYVASSELGEQRVFVFAERANARTLPEALEHLFGARWVRGAGALSLSPRPDREPTADEIWSRHQAQLPLWFRWHRDPTATLETIPAELQPESKTGAFRFDRDCPASELIRSASPAQVAALMAGGLLTGSTKPGAADVDLRPGLEAGAYKHPDGKRLYIRISNRGDGKLVSSWCWEGEIGQTGDRTEVRVSSPFEAESQWARARGGAATSRWDQLSDLDSLDLGEASSRSTITSFWGKRAAELNAMPVLGMSSPIEAHRDYAFANTKSEAGWILVRPRDWERIGLMRTSVGLMKAEWKGTIGESAASRLDRISSKPEGIAGTFCDQASGIFFQSYGPTGVTELWRNLDPAQRRDVLGAGVDYRRLSERAKRAVRAAMALDRDAAKSAFETSTALHVLATGTPLRIQVASTHILSRYAGGAREDLKLPLTAPLPQADAQVSLHSLTSFELQCGEFRGNRRLGNRWLSERLYEGPFGAEPKLATLQRLREP